MEKWGLGPDELRNLNPDLIFTRVSGYGQTGPWSSRPGYASVCEAESGFRYINGQFDSETGALSGAPIRPNISLGDSVAGLHAAFGTVNWFLSVLKVFTSILTAARSGVEAEEDHYR
jgi:crotonobetainyl-CoA:carnitine CoA-transferase CaiB-like acyl-CoA transferase